MISKRLDQQTTKALKSMLQNLNINQSRVVIDLDKQTVEVQDDEQDIEDLLEVAGTLTPERGKELLEEIRKSREEWD
ncbi:hypothetical protein ACFO9Q_15495 [Paenibacillus sp. GCM10023252]|uniref:hypothetical protein n=1 Tax=Paenibacillus sp. GCM10023252 TaxID=3252649 RepID=UPI003616DD44